MAEIRIKEELKPCPKAVLVSIQPRWCRKIASGEKTIEVRKTRPKLETPFKCYIYETKGKTDTPWMDEDGHMDLRGHGMVIGEFVCDSIKDFDFAFSEWAYSVAPPGSIMPMSEGEALRLCHERGKLTDEDVLSYFGDEDWKAYFWSITQLKIYDEPKRITELHSPCEPCVCHSTEKGCTNDFACLHSIERPPQSWCYVAEH